MQPEMYIVLSTITAWLYGPIAAGAALVLTITLFKVPLELMIFDDFEVLLVGSIKSL